MKNFSPGALARARWPLALPVALSLLVPLFCKATVQAQPVPTGSKAYTWGYNLQGRLGDGTTTTRTVPIAVARSGILSGKTVAQVGIGGFHGVALCTDGTLASWGDNMFGELGNGGTTGSLVPVSVDQTGVLNGKTVTQIAIGRLHSLALCSDGTLVSWGYNGEGELGNNSTTTALVPVLVNRSGALSGKTVTQIAAGGVHSLALCSDGTLVSWGYNVHGELGNNSTTTALVPVLVNRSGALSGKTVTQIAAGVNHSLALASDGTVFAWGLNSKGQLGNNSTTNARNPVSVNRSGVLSGKTVTQIAAGGYHSLALTSDGIVASWGYNASGSLGNNTTTSSKIPVLVNRSGVLSGKTVTQISAGAYHSLALRNDGLAVSWGYNVHGELGNNSTTSSKIPVLVNSTNNVSAISGQIVWRLARGSSSFHSLALAYVNGAPVVTDVSINKSAPNTNEVLTAISVASDPNNTPLTYSYVWRKNGVVLSGETGSTLDLSVAGNGDPGDTISVTVVASDGFSSSAPASDSVTVNTPPISVSATQPSGTSSDSSVSHDIRMVYSDEDGADDIAQARLLVNTTASGAQAMMGSYDALANKLYLFNNAGTSISNGYAPGSNYVLNNGQGTLNCAATTVSRSGNTLTINWNFTPNGFFTGTKNLYGLVIDRNGGRQNYRSLGTWAIALNSGNDTPLLQSLTLPGATSASSEPLPVRFVYADPDGQDDIGDVRIVVGSNAAKQNALYASYDPRANKLYLYDDTGTRTLGGFEPGSNRVITNRQGTLNCLTTTVTRGENTLTVNWNFTPNSFYVGDKRVYGFVRDSAGAVDGFRSLGRFTLVLNPENDAPVNRSLSPATISSTTGTAVKLAATYGDSNGFSDIVEARIRINTNPSGAIYGVYRRVENKLYLFDDAGTALMGGFAPGSENTISNSQGTLNCRNTTIVESGRLLVVNWNFTPKSSFTGQKPVYFLVSDAAGASNGFDLKGIWTITALAPIAGSSMPAKSVSGGQS